MSEKRRQYTREFKLEAVQLALNGRGAISDTACRLFAGPAQYAQLLSDRYHISRAGCI